MLFLFIFLVSFFIAFLAQKLIYTINIWFNFVLGSFFEQDHLLNLFILGVYAKRLPKCACSQNLIDGFFFLTVTVRGRFHRKDFKWKKIWGYGVNFWKTEALYAELNEGAEATTSSYSVTGDFLQYISSVPVYKNHQNIRSRCLVQEFSITDTFNDINHGYGAAILKENSLWLLPFYMVVATYFY